MYLIDILINFTKYILLKYIFKNQFFFKFYFFHKKLFADSRILDESMCFNASLLKHICPHNRYTSRKWHFLHTECV